MTAGLSDFDHLTDVTLVCEGKKFPAHKAILGSRCRFFEAMLGGRFAEATMREVQVDSMSATTLKHLLVYLYTGRVRDVQPPELVRGVSLSLSCSFLFSLFSSLVSLFSLLPFG